MGAVEKKWPGTEAETTFAKYLVRTAGAYFVTVVRRGVGEMLGVRVPGQTFVVQELIAAASASTLESLQRENEELQRVNKRLLDEATIHSMEARGANSTIAEIYQIISGGKGEPGNWNGAEPVRKYVEGLRKATFNLCVAYAACNGEDHPAYVEARTALASTGGEHHAE